MPISMNDPIWCSFCEDRPAVGRMVIMADRSRELIGDVPGDDGAACDLHGKAWTGHPIASRGSVDQVAVLQYVHPDYDQVTEDHIVDFAGEKICVKCGDPTEEMPLWVSERILRARPALALEESYQWEGICHECAASDGCPHCEDDRDDRDDRDDDDAGRHYLY